MRLPKWPWWGWLIALLMLVGVVNAITGGARPEAEGAAARGRVATMAQPVSSREVIPDFHALVMPPDAGSDEFVNQARDACDDASICQVGVWLDADLAPRGMPMTDRELNGQVWAYALNRNTGLERQLFDCDLYPQADTARCLARR